MPPFLSLRGAAFRLWIALFLLLAGMLFAPVNMLSLRIGIIAVLCVIVAGSLAFSWRSRAAFICLLGIYAAVGLLLLLPGHQPENLSELQKPYIEALSAYRGVGYVWGGETRFGMDCSGLVRKGFQNALLQTGLRTLNPFLVRGAIDIWWNDTTADGIGKGYEGRTIHVLNCPSLNSLDPTTLHPGDLAVTSGGIHIMAYLGSNRWIGADPSEGKVTIFTIPDAKNGYFSCPMNIMRWDKIRG